MKKYTLEVLTNGEQTIKTYEVYANWVEWGSGCYVFYQRDEEKHQRMVSLYPIQRTIIKQIEDVDNKKS